MTKSTRIDLLSVRELAAMLVSMRKIGVRDRSLVIALLRHAVERHPWILGLWCVFEPMAFDGDDACFVGLDGHDSSGRFAPRWDRNMGSLQLGCSHGHDSPSLGAWYFLPRDSRQEVVFGPYDEKLLTGLSVLCLSRVAPILERDRFIGAVGLDVSLDSLLLLQKGESLSPILEPLEAFFERWHVVLGENNRIEFASPYARRLLSSYVGRCRNGLLPAAVVDRLSRSDVAISESFAGVEGELVITAVQHPHTGQRILSLEERSSSAQVRPVGAMLSRREKEVLEWLEQGKSNGEIALILGISEHTVRHHVERIFAKLGVENRRAAMACANSARVGDGCFISRMPPLGMSHV